MKHLAEENGEWYSDNEFKRIKQDLIDQYYRGELAYEIIHYQRNNVKIKKLCIYWNEIEDFIEIKY